MDGVTAPLNLDALQALCDAATPGEWVCDFPNIFRVEPKPPKGHCPTAIVEEYPNEGGGLVNEADGKFIAACRSALPALIQEVRRLTEENARLVEQAHRAWQNAAQTRDILREATK